MSGFVYPTSASQSSFSQAVIAPGGEQLVTLQLTPTVTMELDELRCSSSAPAPAVAGSNFAAFIVQARTGDGLMWTSESGIPVTLLAGNSTVIPMFLGRRAAPAQPIFLGVAFRNLGSVATATPGHLSATAFGRKRRSC